MKIAIITETFLPSTNGIITRLCDSLRWLKADGHQVLIIAPDQGVSDYEGIPVAGVAAKSFFLKKIGYPKVKDLLADFRPDLVHVVNPALLGAAGIYYSRKLKLPLIVSHHTDVDHRFFNPVLWWYTKKLHTQADLNLCTSSSVMKKLKQKRLKNIQLWDYHADPDQYHPIHFDAAMRDRLTGGQRDKKLLLYVGRLAPENGLKKLREVLEQSADFCLAIVGDGPQRAFLEEYFRDTDTVFTGVLHGTELSSAYASADIFVFPSTTKTAGLVFLEAMASGLPVVAAKCGPTSEQVIEGITGLLYDPADPDGLNQQLSLLKDDAFRIQLADQARTVSQLAAWESSSDHLLTFYKETLDLSEKS